jgi:hypothetical protein
LTSLLILKLSWHWYTVISHRVILNWIKQIWV